MLQPQGVRPGRDGEDRRSPTRVPTVDLDPRTGGVARDTNVGGVGLIELVLYVRRPAKQGSESGKDNKARPEPGAFEQPQQLAPCWRLDDYYKWKMRGCSQCHRPDSSDELPCWGSD